MLNCKPFLFLLLLSLLFISCDSVNKSSQIITVNGSIPSSEMGTTLIHEHVLVDWIGADSTGYHRWDRSEVVEQVLPFFEEAKEKGVNTILECTPAYLGRDPFILEELSKQSGVQILTNTGFYGAVDNTYMPEFAWQESAAEIANRWIGEFENGIDGSEIRPGFIKISVGEERMLSDLHQKIVQAAITTHLETGLTIVAHTIGDIPALEQIELLENGGVSPGAWVWTHAQTGTLDGNMQAAGAGAWISLDGVNHDPADEPGEEGSIEWYANRISELKEAGFLDRVLISHDAGFYEAGTPNGGDFRGYTDIFDYLISALKANNFSEEEIRQLMVTNPQKAYGIQVRGL